MNGSKREKQSNFQGLPNITFRQLEVFRAVCREGSYANAALELRCTRTNVKRVCEDFQKAVGRPLFTEGPDRSLLVTPFAQSLLGQVSPLSRGLRRLEESVRMQHQKGRILRFAAAGEFFKGGLFTDFLGRLKITDTFRPCFLRIEMNRFRTALLNAECDVYFGVGINASDRLDLVKLAPIPWRIETGNRYKGAPPASPAELIPGKWCIADAGEGDAAVVALEAFHAAGAKGGRVLAQDKPAGHGDDEILFSHETTALPEPGAGSVWPCFDFCAVLRKHHPYSELMPRLIGASIS